MPTIRIAVELTETALKNVGVRLAETNSAREKVEAEKSEANKGFSARIKGHLATMHELSETLETGVSYEEVEVNEKPDLVEGIVRLYRADTGAQVGDRPLNDDERQKTIDLPGARGLIDAAASRADEQSADTPAEAEEIRARRLEAEHGDRILDLVKGASDRVFFKDMGDGRTAAVLPPDFLTPEQTAEYASGAVSIPETFMVEVGPSEDDAKVDLLRAYTDTLPKFEAPPAPTLADVAAVAAGDGPKTLLKAPAGAKAKRKRGPRVVVAEADGTETEVTEETLAATAAAVVEPTPALDEGAPAAEPVPTQELCLLDCDIEPPHVHTENRTAF